MSAPGEGHGGLVSADRRGGKPGLEDLLLRHGAITPAQLERAREEQSALGGEVGRMLVELGYISEELYARSLAHELGLPYANPAEDPISLDVVKQLSVQLCERFAVVAIAGDPMRKALRVATSEPRNEAELKSLGASLSGYKLELAVATSDSIHRAIRKFFYGENPRGRPATAPISAHPAPLGPSTPASAPVFAATLVPKDAPSSPTAAAPQTPGAAAATGFGGGAPLRPDLQLEATLSRLSMLEHATAELQRDVSQILTNPHFAAMTARLEQLEQVARVEVDALRVLLDMLCDRGVVRREEYLERLQARSQRKR